MLPSLIRQISEEFKEDEEVRADPTLLWAGLCGDFASALIEALEEKEVPHGVYDVGGDFGDWELDEPFPMPPGMDLDRFKNLGLDQSLNHIWIVHEGRHFDASVPDGVDGILELPNVRISLALWMDEQHPVELPSLVSEHAWWSQSLVMAHEFSAARSEQQPAAIENNHP